LPPVPGIPVLFLSPYVLLPYKKTGTHIFEECTLPDLKEPVWLRMVITMIRDVTFIVEFGYSDIRSICIFLTEHAGSAAREPNLQQAAVIKLFLI